MERTTTHTEPRRYLARIVRLGDRLEAAQMFIGVFCLISLLTFSAIDVAFRSIGKPIVSAQEMATFAYIWAIFMGSGIALRRGVHFEIDLLVATLPVGVRRYLDFLKYFLVLVFTYLLIGPGLEFAMLGIKRVSNPSGFPLLVPTIAIPLGGLFIAYYLIEGIACTLEGTDVGAISARGNEE